MICMFYFFFRIFVGLFYIYFYLSRIFTLLALLALLISLVILISFYSSLMLFFFNGDTLLFLVGIGVNDLLIFFNTSVYIVL